MDDWLTPFSPPVRRWFTETFGQPTPPQEAGWPAIQRGDHTLILAPTGSGKTLAAFLWGIDQIGAASGEGESAETGVRLLYISPLKALNNDIERNLRAPLSGIRALADREGTPWPHIRVAVRTGDTPASARAGMVKHPPHILITTPESLYLILTSPKARNILRTVRSVIVDEIHTLVGEKRGAHLALSLERLEHLASAPIQRIGLSATIRPLDEAARFLGGQEGGRARPVTVVDTGYRKPMEIAVITPVDDFRDMPADSIWPSVIPQVLGDIMRHRSTLVFCNNRRLAERTADRLNAQIAAERSEELEPGSTQALAPGGVSRDKGMFAIGTEGPIRAHHGSMSRERRHEMEEDLKAGRLPALVGTSSLELGIDIGAIDLVVQLQSPKSVSQGLQRVGRAGHLVGQTSRGRIYATFREDLVEAAAVARGMLEGDVEPTKAPNAPLDVLTQQILAMVSVEPWSTTALFHLVRCAYPHRDLTHEAYLSVLEMLSGRYAALGATHRSLHARIAWDKTNDMLYPLPGTRLLALGNAGVITDRGAFDVVLGDRTTRIGTLDEEFVFESRAGDAFILGSNVWRILEIEDDRIVVGDAAGVSPRMPFWRGDYPWRPYELGIRIARLRREVAERLRNETAAEGEHVDIRAWLRREYALDERSARNLADYLARQLEVAGEVAGDDAVIVESFTDAVGEGRVVIHSPFGGRVNGAWALALSDRLSEHLGALPETQVNDDGILFRLPSNMEPEIVAEAVRKMTAREAHERIRRTLPDSALFGAHFRMNAARALMLPRARGRKRTPFWLQRLKAKDMLKLVRRFGDFPLIVETYRECLEDALDLPHLELLLDGIRTGRVRVSAVETVVPSPVAAGLLFNFINTYMYEWDAPKAERQMLELSLHAEAPAAVSGGVGTLLRPEAVAEVVGRASHDAPGRTARSMDELAVFLEQLGDLTEGEALARSAAPEDQARAWLAELVRTGRIAPLEIDPGATLRYIPSELMETYRVAFAARPAGALDAEGQAAAEQIVRRHLGHAGPVSAEDILRRYPFDPGWLGATLRRLVEAREIVPHSAGESPTYLDTRLFEQARRRTIAILRKEVQPVSPATFVDFLAHWQHLGSDRFSRGAEGVQSALKQLRGFQLPLPLWEREILPGRVQAFTPTDLSAALAQCLAWAAQAGETRRARVAFFPRGEGRLVLAGPETSGLSDHAVRVYELLREEGASLLSDLQSGLGLSAPVARAALVELALAGLAASDTLDGLRAVLDFAAPAEVTPRTVSALEADLEARRSRPAQIVRAIDHRRAGDVRRSVRRRLQREQELTSVIAAADPWSGRWSLLHRAGVLGPALSDEELATARARVLLERYGVLTRESVRREAGPFEWGALAGALALMELRGEARRGFFVAGFWGVQYALPEAVERLRAAGAVSQDDAPLIVLNAMDPAQAFGLSSVEGVLPGAGATPDADTPPPPEEDAPRFTRTASTHLVFRAGRLLLLAEERGERMWTPEWASAELIQRAVAAYLGRPGAARHVVVRRWNGAQALGGPAQAILQPLGFTRTPTDLERWG